MTGSCELNDFDLGDGDLAISGPEWARQRQNFRPDIHRTVIYEKFLVIAEIAGLTTVKLSVPVSKEIMQLTAGLTGLAPYILLNF